MATDPTQTGRVAPPAAGTPAPPPGTDPGQAGYGLTFTPTTPYWTQWVQRYGGVNYFTGMTPTEAVQSLNWLQRTYPNGLPAHSTIGPDGSIGIGNTTGGQIIGDLKNLAKIAAIAGTGAILSGAIAPGAASGAATGGAAVGGGTAATTAGGAATGTAAGAGGLTSGAVGAGATGGGVVGGVGTAGGILGTAAKLAPVLGGAAKSQSNAEQLANQTDLQFANANATLPGTRLAEATRASLANTDPYKITFNGPGSGLRGPSVTTTGGFNPATLPPNVKTLANSVIDQELQQQLSGPLKPKGNSTTDNLLGLLATGAGVAGSFAK